MRSTIEPRDILKVKSLILTLFLTALMSESVQAQFIPTITAPRITVPTITVPEIKIYQPTVAVPQITPIPSSFEVKVPAGSTRPSFISVIQEENKPLEKITGLGGINIPIPAVRTTTIINVVIPSQNIVAPENVNLNVNLTPIPDVGSVVNSVNFSFPLPALD
jgi:hypothetical protein